MESIKQQSETYPVRILLDPNIPREKTIIDLIQRYPNHSRSKSALLHEALLLGIGSAMQNYPPPKERVVSDHRDEQVTPAPSATRRTEHRSERAANAQTNASAASRSIPDTGRAQSAADGITSEWAPLAATMLSDVHSVRHPDDAVHGDLSRNNGTSDKRENSDDGDGGTDGDADFGYFSGLLDT